MPTLERYTAGQTHHVNMGAYEWVELTHSATAVGLPGETGDEVAEFAENLVEARLAADLERAIETTAEEETYVETWVNGPRRSRSRTRPANRRK